MGANTMGSLTKLSYEKVIVVRGVKVTVRADSKEKLQRLVKEFTECERDQTRNEWANNNLVD